MVPQVVGTVGIFTWEASSFSGCIRLSAFPLPRWGFWRIFYLGEITWAGLELIILGQVSLEPMNLLASVTPSAEMKRLTRNVNF